MNKSLTVLLFCILLGILSCQEKQEQQQENTQIEELPVKFRDSVLINIKLSQDAAAATASWKGYEVLEQALRDLDNSAIGSVKTEIDQWVVATEEIQRQKPDSLQDKSIESRLTVLNTKAHTLKQKVEKRDIDTAEVNQEATEFYNAFQDLKLQINMKFQKSIDDILNEFDTENIELRKSLQIDSVKQQIVN
ncbi:hypothetical protein ACH3O9_06215 [Leeuwenhoekiella sp. A16]|uniref:hypothetical protein n=1 Tax=unclassified Leeuwenhoekiella TaxID=2615029 RepID=UPI003A80B964